MTEVIETTEAEALISEIAQLEKDKEEIMDTMSQLVGTRSKQAQEVQELENQHTMIKASIVTHQNVLQGLKEEVAKNIEKNNEIARKCQEKTDTLAILEKKCATLDEKIKSIIT